MEINLTDNEQKKNLKSVQLILQLPGLHVRLQYMLINTSGVGISMISILPTQQPYIELKCIILL